MVDEAGVPRIRLATTRGEAEDGQTSSNARVVLLDGDGFERVTMSVSPRSAS
ncbi:MAG TPA: hypothetical protein VEW93_13835 [Acidimicrobiales bacterium]|nr:hypothetical protein [Acidimicrobiales bacterium]